MLTGDKRNLEVTSYVVWRVGDPSRFLRSAATLEGAEARLSERVSASLSNAIGRRDLSAIASIDPKLWQLDALEEDVRRALELRRAGWEPVAVTARMVDREPLRALAAVVSVVAPRRSAA